MRYRKSKARKENSPKTKLCDIRFNRSSIFWSSTGSTKECEDLKLVKVCMMSQLLCVYYCNFLVHKVCICFLNNQGRNNFHSDRRPSTLWTLESRIRRRGRFLQSKLSPTVWDNAPYNPDSTVFTETQCKARDAV